MGNYMYANDTLMFHLVTLTVSWNILANVSAYMALYKHTVLGYYSHAIISWLIIILTLVSALIYIIPKGFPQQCHIQGTIDCDRFQFPLAIEGTVLLVWLAVQIFSGIFARAWQENPRAKSLDVIRSRKFHWYSGYFIMLLGKANCFVHWRAVPEIWIPLIVWEVVTIGAYIKRKWFFYNLEEAIVEPQVAKLTEDVPKVKYVEELTKGKTEYVIFADYVYDIGPLMTLHPAGYQIVECVKGREIDRFIYGMYAAEPLPEVPVYSHPLKSFELCGPPVAKIDNPSPYTNMAELNECYLSYKELVSEVSQIYIVGFTSLTGKDFKYLGYSQVSQLGQYFSLTINKKTTRLYTTVNCLCMSNRRIMEQIIAKYPLPNMKVDVIPDKIPEIRLRKSTTKIGDGLKPDTNRKLSLYDSEDEADKLVPLMIRKYETGKLTPPLVAEEQPEDLVISCTRGQGLKLETLPSGRIVVIAGGTGFYPFMDLVDLLYKKRILDNDKAERTFAEKIRRLNPVLNGPFLGEFTFQFYIAINAPEDFHPMTLYQLNELCGGDHVECIFRLRDKKEEFQRIYKKFKFTNDRFDSVALPDILSNTTSKVYICGPPVMNHSMVQLMKDNRVSENKYELV